MTTFLIISIVVFSVVLAVILAILSTSRIEETGENTFKEIDSWISECFLIAKFSNEECLGRKDFPFDGIEIGIENLVGHAIKPGQRNNECLHAITKFVLGDYYEEFIKNYDCGSCFTESMFVHVLFSAISYAKNQTFNVSTGEPKQSG